MGTFGREGNHGEVGKVSSNPHSLPLQWMKQSFLHIGCIFPKLIWDFQLLTLTQPDLLLGRTKNPNGSCECPEESYLTPWELGKCKEINQKYTSYVIWEQGFGVE